MRHGLSRWVQCVGVCIPVVALVPETRADYHDEVLADNPLAYWRLNEGGGTVAMNLGSGGAALDGFYSGSVVLEEAGLIFDDPDPAVYFSGFDAEIQIPDSTLVNTGGPYVTRTVELWFQADTIDLDPRILFEEGGATRGLNMFVQEIDGESRIFMAGWNRAQESWDPVVVSTEIEEGEIYHAILVFDASANEQFGDFDGRITGYLDGDEFETALGADRLYAHGDDSAIGGIHVNSLFPDLTNPGDGANFEGTIDEVALYDIALDDPDGDKDRSDSRVLEHYRAGSRPAEDPTAEFHRGDTDDDGTITISDAVFMLLFLFAGGRDTTCKETQDIDNDGNVLITDAVGMLLFLFSSGPPPAPPGPTTQACGPDPDPLNSPGDLGCEAYTHCG